MTKTITFAITAFLVIGLATSPGLQNAMAKSNFVICADTIIDNQVVNSGILVPSGTNCIISESTINGGITIESESGLILEQSTVVGKVVANNADAFLISDSTIFGDLLLNNVAGGSAASGENTIHGDAIVKKGGTFALTGTLNGNLVLNEATFAVGGLINGKVTITDTVNGGFVDTTITGNAMCKGDNSSLFVSNITYLGKVKGCPV
ncbi:MAG TPA: hypothetical protein VD731_01915 [Nitrosopumilaceae archaeon]|nr:hypothetical protein [Nitrosopumilaceae archaeon]